MLRKFPWIVKYRRYFVAWHIAARINEEHLAVIIVY